MKLKPNKIFIDLEMVLTFTRSLSDALRKSGITYRDKYLDDVIKHPALTERLKNKLLKEIEAIITRNGRKCPRPAMRPKKDWSRQF